MLHGGQIHRSLVYQGQKATRRANEDLWNRCLQVLAIQGDRNTTVDYLRVELKGEYIEVILDSIKVVMYRRSQVFLHTIVLLEDLVGQLTHRRNHNNLDATGE